MSDAKNARDAFPGMLPCPFCGSDVQYLKSVWKYWRFVACDCKAGGAPARTDAKAVENWNRRAGR